MLLDPELITRLAPLHLKARTIAEGFIAGLHRSPFHGFSVEFAEHRPYNQGDDFKHIDWKVYGKTERFYVKQFEAETNLRAHVVLDISPSMHFKYHAEWTKLQYAIHLAAALVYMLNRQRDACGLALFDEEIQFSLPPKSSYGHIQHIFGRLEEELAKESSSSEKRRRSASSAALHQLAEQLRRRSLVIILTDLFENVRHHDELISSMRHLKHQKHEVLLFNILEKRSERDLEMPDGKFLFEDMETSEELEVIPAQVREAYRARIEEYLKKFRIACSDAGVDFEEIDTESSFDIALLAWLNKRKRLS